MINTNYRIDALEILLDKQCLLERYHPLINYKYKIIELSKKLGLKTKDDLKKLSEKDLDNIGFKDKNTINLFLRFLDLYEPNKQKFKEIEKLNISNNKHDSFVELYYLPGVKQTRASLYYDSGYKHLIDIAVADINDILKNTAKTISLNKLSCTAPLPKEVRTHIAVAKAFTIFNK